MSKYLEPNTSSQSATFVYRRVKIRGPRTTVRQPPAGRRTSLLHRLTRLDRSERCTVDIRFSGGPESKWVLRFRGAVWYCPGWMALEDVCAVLYGEVRPGEGA